MNKIIVPGYVGRFIARAKARDVAFKYRMGNGFAGDINRAHPFSVEPCLVDSSSPPLGYGLAVVLNAGGTGVRQLAAGDAGITAIYGITVRPYPIQQKVSTDLSASFGGATPPTDQVIDVLRLGYILVPLYGTAVKGGAVYVRVQNPGVAPAQVVGGCEAVDDGGNTAGPILNCAFNGPADASTPPVGELIVNSMANIT